MAYIECPQCGQSALDVATRCPRCGFGFAQHRLRHGERRPTERHRYPLWIGGSILVLATVFLAGRRGGFSGGVTVPPVASGLDSEPQSVLVQTDSGAGQPDGDAPVTANSADDTTSMAGSTEGVDDAIPVADGAVSPTPSPRDTAARVVVIEPPGTPAPALPAPPVDIRWASTWVNVRAGRSGSSEAVRVLNPGDQVGVDSLGRGWFRVLIDGVPVGYVDRSFLAMSPPDSLPG